jgi:hypothetical protein
MKIQQTNTEFTIKMGAGSALFIGTIFTLIGLVATIVLLGNTQKWFVLFGLAFVATGLFFIASASKRTVIFQKEGNTTITNKNVLFGAPKVQTFPTSNIARVSIESHTEYQNRSVNDTGSSLDRTVSEPVLIGTLSIVLNDGSSIAIDTASRNQSMSNNSFTINGIPIGGIISAVKSFSGKPPLANEAEKLAGFLGVPFVSEGSTGSIIGDITQALSGQGATTQTTADPAPMPQPTDFSPTPPAPAQPQPVPTPLPMQPVAQAQTPVFPPANQTTQPIEQPATPNAQPPQAPSAQQF